MPTGPGQRLFSARYELRLGRRESRHLLTASGALRPRDDWTLFARERLFLSAPDGSGSAWRAEGLLGAAYRPCGKRWSFLSRLDHSTSSGVAATPGGAVPGSAFAEPAYSLSNPAPVAVPDGVGIRRRQERRRPGLDRGLRSPPERASRPGSGSPRR